MPLTVERRDRSSGFSLVEVLAALAIAAALSAALMHTFSNTRYSATRIRELIDSMTLGDNLLSHMSAQKIQPTRIDGRDGGFTWRIVIEPVNYPLNIIKYSEIIQPD